MHVRNYSERFFSKKEWEISKLKYNSRREREGNRNKDLASKLRHCDVLAQLFFASTRTFQKNAGTKGSRIKH